MLVWSLGREDSLEKSMATHSSILLRRIPWTEKPGRLQSIGLQRVGHDWSNSTTHVVDLQCCISFRCTAKWLLCIHIYHSFHILSHIGYYKNWVEFLVLYSRSLLIICFTSSNVYMLIPCTKRSVYMLTLKLQLGNNLVSFLWRIFIHQCQ